MTLIVVDYKTPERTLRYIQNFMYCTTENVHVLIVDNSGESVWESYCEKENYLISIEKDLDIEYCKKVWYAQKDKLEFVCVTATENLGYGRGNNLGISVCKKLWDETRALISNNDLEFPSGMHFDAYERVLREHPDVAMIGPMVKSPSGEQQSPHIKVGILQAIILRYIFLLINPSWTKKISDVSYVNQNSYAYWVTGCFVYIDVDKFIESGMFDSSTFLYGEEKIMAERLKQCGYQMYFLADETIIHNHGQTVRSAMSVLNAHSHGLRSQLHYYKDYLGVNSSWLFLARCSFTLYKCFYPIRGWIKKCKKNH